MYSDFCVFNDTATTEIYTYVHTLSLHVALPIWTRPMPNISAKNINARMSLSATAAITFDGTILTIAAIPDGASRELEKIACEPPPARESTDREKAGMTTSTGPSSLNNDSNNTTATAATHVSKDVVFIANRHIRQSRW